MASLAHPSRPLPGAGPYVLRTLFKDLPLSEDGSSGDDVTINCVEYLNNNLYVGTSDSELLHFVQIPPDPADTDGIPTFILASRLRPPFPESAETRPGVQEILLLPNVEKACILCNSTVTFYSLPELSPVFGLQVKKCGWIGGVDLNKGDPDSAVVLLSLRTKIQVVRITDKAQVLKNIDFAANKLSIRRDSIACVADSRNYALLEINRQLKIPLMSISPLDDTLPGTILGQAQHISGGPGNGISRSHSSAHPRPQNENTQPSSHRKTTSLGNLISNVNRKPEQSTIDAEESSFSQTTPPESVASPGPPEESVAEAPSNGTDNKTSKAVLLRPHVVSPTPDEFLLVTGTAPSEPGIGIFVNLDGDPTRPTIKFDSYPHAVAVDGGVPDLSSSRMPMTLDAEGFVIASMEKEMNDGIHAGLEIQRWDAEDGEAEPVKYWIEPNDNASKKVATFQAPGIRSLLGADTVHFQEIVTKLSRRQFTPFSSGAIEHSTVSLKSVDSRTALSMERVSKEKGLFDGDNDSQDEDALPEGWQATRNAEEEEFTRRLAGGTVRLAVWCGSHIWWAVRNPLILQLDTLLDAASAASDQLLERRQELIRIINSIRGRDARSELEFLTLSYVRQRAGILLVTNFLKSDQHHFTEAECKAMEEVLVESQLDPRVVLSIIPGVRNEVIETRRGIWIFGGVKITAEEFISSRDFEAQAQTTLGGMSPPVLRFLRHFLSTWRRKKGFGSVPDENEVFRTVDAALLAVLLELDQHSPPGLGRGRSIRTELYDLVDKGVDCFDRAQTILESYHRLFVLSRLYQSRKMAQEVLETWRRIIEGERNDGGEFPDGEGAVREYLTKISNQALVQEYGLWLANRNPKLGVQVFAEDQGRATKFEPAYVVELLRREAPDAVRFYLEFLVFGKGHTIYVNELINYYLDVVVTRLQTSPEARNIVLSTYEAYRALQPPKPTYRQFLTDNAPPVDEAWQSRLRLLQLLGRNYDYDSSSIRDRIANLNTIAADLLVPETIILDGRERNHENALRLLVHHLGDYDTAVSYCFRGGASVYSIYRASTQTRPPPSPEDLRAPKRRDSVPPTQDQQARLFRALLGEFLQLEDENDRLEQTSLLLDRFGGWFDIGDILSVVPDSWSVDTVAGFLMKALRKIVAEKNETMVARSLSSAQNLKIQHELVMEIEEKGPTIEP
ncbi:hypothetical protein F5Y16DRAFT_373714 [Xylariaceae sp. FL0255]|nr:hypothetical protein F5Y16DRAFT_373714 [Xylariaceae sp. FL0255]